MASLSTILPEGFYQAVRQRVEQSAQGASEYELLGVLREHGFFPFWHQTPALPEELFRAHFLLFHCLYQLRDEYLQAQQAWLQIDVLKIQLLPYQLGEKTLGEVDNLRKYYLDASNLDQTPTDINEMIADFWLRLSKVEQRADALAELGLEDPVDNITIRQAYRRMVMKHHPDRGGDSKRIQEINAALSALLD